MGEIHTLGLRPDGNPWRVALRGLAGAAALPDTTNKAVATSGAEAFQFDRDGRCNHLFNPATGHCADPARSLTVVAATAVAADALSTAFAIMNQEQITAVIKRTPETRVLVSAIEGTREITAERGS